MANNKTAEVVCLHADLDRDGATNQTKRLIDLFDRRKDRAASNQSRGLDDDDGALDDVVPSPVNPDDGSCEIADASLSCTGDCNLDCHVHVDEIVTVIAIALGNRPLSDCVAADRDGDGGVTVHELVRSVLFATDGC